MAYFDKDDIQKSFVKAMTDTVKNNEWSQKARGIIALYEQIIADMDEEDREREKALAKAREAASGSNESVQ